MAKKRKGFLPKKIAGVKVPRKVRKGQLGELIASPTGQKIIAQAILAGGALVAGRKAAKSDTALAAAKGAKAKAVTAVGKVQAATPQLDAETLSYAFAEAAKTFAAALRHGTTPEARSFERSWTPLDDSAAQPAGQARVAEAAPEPLQP